MKKHRIFQVFLILVAILIILFIVYRYVFPPALKPGNYSTSIVDYGPVFTSVPASGVVNPQNEVLMLSPATSIVSTIYMAPGSKVSKGTIILVLDPKPLTQEIDNLKDVLNVMENDLQKNRLNARSTRVDLDYNAEVKNLKITSLKNEIADQDQLLKVGGISPALAEQTKQELVLAEKDLKTTLEKNSIRLKQLEADEKGLQLQIDMKRKELDTKLDLLNRLTVRAPSDGIILGIYANAGERVDRDKVLVKMSDMSTFKIIGSVDNQYIDVMKTGGEVYAIVDHTRLKGKIGNVSPVIKDKKIDFDVYIDYSKNPKLMPNMEITLMVVNKQLDSVLRVEQGPAFNHNKHQDVFVVKNGRAVRQKITTGLIGTEFIEISEGLKPGDRIITSDVSPFRHKGEIVFEDMN
jgi:HlyD family secretion protein